jgi:hypothetical protein
VLTDVGGQVIGSSNDWVTEGQVTEIGASGYAPPHDQEPAMLITLQPGAYTPIVNGVGGETGVGLVEIYELDFATAP